MAMILLQINETVGIVDKIFALSEKASTTGLLFALVFFMGYLIYQKGKKITRLQDDRLKEAKENGEKINAIASAFMTQTNKMILVMELFKEKTK